MGYNSTISVLIWYSNENVKERQRKSFLNNPSSFPIVYLTLSSFFPYYLQSGDSHINGKNSNWFSNIIFPGGICFHELKNMRVESLPRERNKSCSIIDHLLSDIVVIPPTHTLPAVTTHMKLNYFN